MNGMNILYFGASTVYGAGDLEGGWVARLRRAREGKGLVYNLGISSGTSGDLLQRFETELVARLDQRVATAITITTGGNDAAFIPSEQRFRVSPEHFAKNLSKLIGIARTYAQYLFIHTLTPVNDLVTINQPGRDRSKSNAQNALFNAQIKRICESQKVPVVDIGRVFLENNYLVLLSADGVHPNAAGHELIFQLTHQALLNL